jgi:hypothetical protein
MAPEILLPCSVLNHVVHQMNTARIFTVGATKAKFKNTDFVDIMISDVLRDLGFSLNQPLKSADDCTLEY